MLEILRPVEGVQDGLVCVGKRPPMPLIIIIMIITIITITDLIPLPPPHTELLEARMQQSHNVHRGHLPDTSKDDTMYYPHHNSEMRDSHEYVQKQV